MKKGVKICIVVTIVAVVVIVAAFVAVALGMRPKEPTITVSALRANTLSVNYNSSDPQSSTASVDISVDISIKNNARAKGEGDTITLQISDASSGVSLGEVSASLEFDIEKDATKTTTLNFVSTLTYSAYSTTIQAWDNLRNTGSQVTFSFTGTVSLTFMRRSLDTDYTGEQSASFTN